MKTAIIAALALGASAFAPAPSQTRSTALNAQKPVSNHHARRMLRLQTPPAAAAEPRSSTQSFRNEKCKRGCLHASSVHTPRIPSAWRRGPAAPPTFARGWSTRQPRLRRAAADLPVSARGGNRLSATTATTTFTKRQSKSQPKPSRRRSREFPSQVRPRRPVRRPVEEDAGRQEEERRCQQALVPQGRGPGRRRQGVPRGPREEADLLPRRRGQQPRERHGPQVGQGQVRRVHEGGLRRVARQGRQEAAEPDVLSARCARRPLTYDLSNI